MKFTEFFIRRPIFAVAMSLLLLLTGLLAYHKLTLRQFPKIAANVINISTKYKGASASLMESFVTTPIENSLTGISNVDYMTSTSSNSKSSINLNLKLNSDINKAMIDVESKLSHISKSLPDDVDDPVMTEVDADSMPSMIVIFYSADRSAVQLTDFVNKSITPTLNNVDGVASVGLWGKNYAMRIWLDVNKMHALNITASDVENALLLQNVQSASGEIQGNQQILQIQADTGLHNAADFNNLIIKKTTNNHLIRLSNIGYAKFASAKTTSSMYANGKYGIGMGISYKNDANPLTVAKQIKHTLNNLHLPSDISYKTVRDNATYIQASLEEVILTFAITISCVLAIIFLFLGSLRLTLIPLVTIPLSLIGAGIILLVFNFSINTITLLAFVLAIGMVVDDAIVVMENIYRHVKNMSPLKAAILGSKQICFAVIAMTVTLMAVYAPIGFASSLTGILFREFAFTLAGTVLISGIIALTLTPMMCSKILSSKLHEAKFANFVNRVLNILTQAYASILEKCLQNKFSIFILLISILLIGILFLRPLLRTSSIAPKEDQGVLFAIAKGPSSASLNYTQKYTQQIADVYQKVPELSDYIIVNGHPGGESNAFAIMILKTWQQRNRSVSQIIQSIQPQIDKITGMKIFMTQPSSLPGSNSNYQFELVITSTKNYTELLQTAEKLMQKTKSNPNILRLSSDLNMKQPFVKVNINRLKAAWLGVSMSDINNALSIAFGEPTINEFSLDGYAYYVIPQVLNAQSKETNVIQRLSVRSSTGDLISLATVVSINQTHEASNLGHYQGQRAVTLDAQLAPGYSTQQAIDYFKQLLPQVITSNQSYTFSGDTLQYLKNNSNMLMIFIAALLTIYLVLAAQFESVLDPLIIMISVPLALTGALTCIFISGSSLNIYTEIGLVTLIGLISKHGILILEFAKQSRREKNISAYNAILEAAKTRFRPILMTTATMVLGSIPLIFAGGAGANARNQLGWTIAGGMTIGTICTLFILPVIYLTLRNNKK